MEMNKSDQLLEFIDGTLEGADEQTLFESLAAEPELRTELRDFVQIGQAVRADREAFAPPADVERRLLGGLGLLPIGAAASGAGGAAAGGLFSGLLGKGGIVPILLGTLLGGLIATGGFLLADGGAESRGAEGESLRSASSVTTASIDDPAPYLAMIGGAGLTHGVVDRHGRGAEVAGLLAERRERRSERRAERRANMMSDRQERRDQVRDGGIRPTDRRRGAFGAGRERMEERLRDLRGQNQRLREELALLKQSSSSNASENRDALDVNGRDEGGIALEIPELAATSAKVESLDLADPSRKSDAEADRARSALPKLAPARFPETEQVGSGRYLGLEVRNFVVNSPVVDNQAREVATNFAQENIVLGGYYSGGDGWQVGLEAGRERYTQSFFYNRGDSIVIEQRPIVGWGGLAARLETDLLSLPVTLGGTVGASQYGGPVARGLLSADLLGLVTGTTSNAGPLRIPLALEASSLVYTFNDQYFVSGNWGLNLGLQYRVGL